MADIDKGLPIRTEDDPDQYVRTRQFDSTDETQGQDVDSDGNAHVEVHGNRCDDAADVALELSEEGRPNARGDYEADDNSCPSTSGLIAHNRDVAPDDTDLLKRVTAKTGTVDTDVVAMDVSIHDELGNAFTTLNPLPVQPVGLPGAPVHDFNEGVDIAAGATSDHDYSVPSGQTFYLKQIIASASSRFRYKLQLGDGGAVEVFADVAVRFQSEDQDNADMILAEPMEVVGTANTTTIKLIRQNRDDDDAQSLYTTIVGSLD